MMRDSEQCLHEGVASKRRKVPGNSLCNLPMLPSDFKGFLNLKSLTLVDVRIIDDDVQHAASSSSTPTAASSYAPTVVASSAQAAAQAEALRAPLNPLTSIVGLLGRTVQPPPLTPAVAAAYHAELTALATATGLADPAGLADLAATTGLRGFAGSLPLDGGMRMWTGLMCRERPYCKEDGELRTGLPHEHAHLKSVRICGFFGYKDQLELALHILHSSTVLEKMEITPKIRDK
nr:unnamed protein product [Digitaria exilis]CAB3445983.1 unnamed protein product [Digitaria exilis]